MANEVSFSMAYNGDAIDVLATGSQTVTEGTSAPGAGNIEIRIGDPSVSPWTKRQIRVALDTMFRFLDDPNRSSSLNNL